VRVLGAEIHEQIRDRRDAGQGIEDAVAAGDVEQIGTGGVDVRSAVKIIGEALMAAGKMGVGNLGQAKFGHAILLPGPIIHRSEVAAMTISHITHTPSSSLAKARDPVVQTRQY
jgi:hypothetical protein